jgi:hypothetical protein
MRARAEQAAAVGVVHRLRRGPDAEALAVVGEEASEQGADAGVGDAGDVGLEFAPHLVERTRCDGDQILFVEADGAILVGVDTADAVDRQLQHALIRLAGALDFDEVLLVELVAHTRDVVEDLGLDRAGAVLQRENQEGSPLRVVRSSLRAQR